MLSVGERRDRMFKHFQCSRFKLILVIFLSLILFLPGCNKEKVNDTLLLATTTSTQDSGLLDVLVPAFEKESNLKVKVIAVGSGQALEMGRKGDADVLLVHSPKAETEFLEAGYGVSRYPVMYNKFVLAGPKDDPAGVQGIKDVIVVLQKIAKTESNFVSRGDNSGTHVKEMALWEEALIKPQGKWYIETGQGMGETLLLADEKNAYVLTDEATYLSLKDKLKLEVFVDNDERLFNPYSVIAVNPEKNKGVNYEGAVAFIKFITGQKGQEIIRSFGTEKYGKPLFVPDAKVE